MYSSNDHRDPAGSASATAAWWHVRTACPGHRTTLRGGTTPSWGGAGARGDAAADGRGLHPLDGRAQTSQQLLPASCWLSDCRGRPTVSDLPRPNRRTSCSEPSLASISYPNVDHLLNATK